MPPEPRSQQYARQADKLLEQRRAPHNLEAEQAVLGAILIDNTIAGDLAGMLEPAHFFDPLHARIYEAIRVLIAAGKKATPITLKAYFEQAEPIDTVTTTTRYLGRLAARAPTTANARDYAETVLDHAKRRALIVLGEDIQRSAYEPEPDFPIGEQIAEHEARLRALDAEGAVSVTRDLAFADDADLDTEALEIWEDSVSPRAVAGLYGPLGSAKTFLMIGLEFHIALGRPFLGRPVAEGCALYVPLEGRGTFKRRLMAAREAYGDPGRRFGYMTALGTLRDNPEGRRFTRRIIATGRELARAGDAPLRLVVIDTYARAMGGENENDAAVANQALVAAQQIVEATGASVLFVAHPGKDASKGLRGNYALAAGLDDLLRIDREKGAEVRHLAQEKSRDGEEGPRGAFTIERHTLGTNACGKPITSCSVAPAEAPGGPGAKPRAKLPRGTTVALDALHEALDAFGKPAPASIDISASVRVVEIRHWRAEAYRRGISTGEGRAREIAFERAKDRLADHRIVVIRDDLAWVTS